MDDSGPQRETASGDQGFSGQTAGTKIPQPPAPHTYRDRSTQGAIEDVLVGIIDPETGDLLFFHSTTIKHTHGLVRGKDEPTGILVEFRERLGK